MPDMQRVADGVEITTESAVVRTGPDAQEQERVKRILKIARRQFRECANRTRFWREWALLDRKVRAGTWGRKSYQWPEGVQELREADNRPCITVNRVPTFVRLVTNQARAANLRARVSPVDDNGDPETAETIQGLIRNVEIQSYAERVYAKGSDNQAEVGLGFIRVVTEWAEPDNPDSFKQRIRLKQVKDPRHVYVGYAEEPDWSDARDAYQVSAVDVDTYLEMRGLRPGADDDKIPRMEQLASFGGSDEEAIDWFPGDRILVAEWFHIEPYGQRVHRAELEDGRVVDFPAGPHTSDVVTVDGKRVVRSRWVQPTRMMWRKIDAMHILEESVWAPKKQPFIPIVGDELELEGEVDYRGVVRDMAGQQMAYNVEVTGLLEQVALGTKSPLVGYRGQFGKPGDKLRTAWENAHKQPTPFLEVEMLDIDGKPAPLPQRAAFEPPIAGIIAAIQQTDNDMKMTGGWNDASLAERGPQESGRAIKLRQDQDNLANSHYLDNLRFAVAAAARTQLIPLIRTIYDAPTVVRILGKDERPKKVMVFAGAENDPRQERFLQTGPDGALVPFQLPQGVSGIFDLNAGEYDVEVTATKNSGTRRQEELELMGNVLKGLPPEVGMKFLDLFFMLLDSAVGRQMAERAKKMFPPPEEQEDGQPNPAEAQQAVAMLQQQLEVAKEIIAQFEQQQASEAQKLAAQRDIKEAELDSKERIAAAERVHEEKMLVLKAQLDALQTKVDTLAEMSMRRIDHAEQAGARIAEQGNRDRDRDDSERTRQQEREDAERQRQEDRADAAAEREAAQRSQPKGGD